MLHMFCIMTDTGRGALVRKFDDPMSSRFQGRLAQLLAELCVQHGVELEPDQVLVQPPILDDDQLVALSFIIGGNWDGVPHKHLGAIENEMEIEVASWDSALELGGVLVDIVGDGKLPEPSTLRPHRPA